MKKLLSYGGYAITFVLIAVAALGTGYAWGHTQAQTVAVPKTVINAQVPADIASSTDFALFWKVWNLLDQKYAPVYGGASTTDQDKLYGAIKGLAATYGDPYTVFFPPSDEKDFESQLSGNFEGVGMEVSAKNDILTVVAPLKGSPAEKAGILAGDEILKIDSTVTSNVTVDQAVKLIRGAKGTTVHLVILHPNTQTPVEINIVRDVINVPVLETKQLPSGIYEISLNSFSEDSPALFANAIHSFVASGDTKLIIDLRGNPGGYLDAAVDMASWFLPSGDVVVSEVFKDSSQNNYYRSKGYNLVDGRYSTVILVDGGSASASEIFSGALHEYGKATLVGTTTFGKGSVQEYLQVTPDTALKVTVARWLTPKGISISQKGITPDVVVKMTQADADAHRDPQLDKAVSILLTK